MNNVPLIAHETQPTQTMAAMVRRGLDQLWSDVHSVRTSVR
jgi:hypothetical protein